MPTAAYYTLGCKVNQYETETIRQQMESQGFDTVPFSASADVYVINTCTVTSVADGKSRHAVRQAIKRNPSAMVVATGCYAELDAEAITAIDGVGMIVPNELKDEIAPRAAARFPSLATREAIPAPRTRTRAILKVQDGCDQFCAYCTVPYARTGRRSRLVEEVIREAETLAGFGYKEVVLTGIRLGSYSSGDTGIAELARRVSRIRGIERVRLSSIEVWEITEELISLMAENTKLCPHLHVPLQSGDDETLTQMSRPYDSNVYAEVVAKARLAIPDLAVSTDVLVGFPGETDASFDRSLAFVEKMHFSRLHVFRYSRRPRTKAATMDGHVSETVKEQRSSRMIELGDQMAAEFARKYAGRNMQVLVEHKREAGGKLTGHTSNYVEVEFDGPASLAGSLTTVQIEANSGAKLIGCLVSEANNQTGG